MVEIRRYQDIARLGSVSGDRRIEVLDPLPFLLERCLDDPESVADLVCPLDPLELRSNELEAILERVTSLRPGKPLDPVDAPRNGDRSRP